MRRLVIIPTLALALTLALTACGGNQMDLAAIENELAIDVAAVNPRVTGVTAQCAPKSDTRARCLVSRKYGATPDPLAPSPPHTETEVVAVTYNPDTGQASWKGRQA